MPAKRKKALFPKSGPHAATRTRRAYFNEYVIEDGDLKKVDVPALGVRSKMRGRLVSNNSVIHMVGDAFPEPVDGIHTFAIEFPTPGLVNEIPLSDADTNIVPMVHDAVTEVIHRRSTMLIPGTNARCPQILAKNIGIWFSNEDLSYRQKTFKNFEVKDVDDLMLKYRPNGLTMYRTKVSKVSALEGVTYDAIGINRGKNVRASAAGNIATMGNSWKVRADSASKTGVHIWDVNDELQIIPMTDPLWNKDTGTCMTQKLYMHLWLEEGVLDEWTSIYFNITWSLKEVSGREIVYYENFLENREKLLSTGTYVNHELNAYKTKLQKVYSLKGEGDEELYQWDCYVDGGRMITHLNPAIYEMRHDITAGVAVQDIDSDDPDKVTERRDYRRIPYIDAAIAGFTTADKTAVGQQDQVILDSDENDPKRKAYTMIEGNKIVTEDDIDGPPPSRASSPLRKRRRDESPSGQDEA